MSRVDPVRSWKDPLYRDALSAEERAALRHPSGLVEISDAELKAASGAEGLIHTTFRTCTEYTFKRFHCCP